MKRLRWRHRNHLIGQLCIPFNSVPTIKDIVLFEANLQWDNQRSPKTVSVQSWDIAQQKLSQAIRQKTVGLAVINSRQTV